jgi:HEAT repeat protein
LGNSSTGSNLSAIADLDSQLAKVLDLWKGEKVEALIPYLLTRSEQYEGLQAIAAFALGSLQTERAVDVIVQAFLMRGFSREAYRNVCTALTLLDPGVVTKRAIVPLLDHHAAEEQGLSPDTWEAREQWYEHLAYLIGRIRTASERAYVFLHRCLYESSDVQLKSLAIQSLGWLYDRDSKRLFERIALGQFSTTTCFCHLRGNPSDFWFEVFVVTDLAADLNIPDDLSPIERLDLQRRALEALSYVGDSETLERLAARPPDWDLELEQAFYWTTEEILARLSEAYL